MKKIEFMPCEFCPEGCKCYAPELRTTETNYINEYPRTVDVHLACAHEQACRALIENPHVNMTVNLTLDDTSVEEAAHKIAERFTAHVAESGMGC